MPDSLSIANLTHSSLCPSYNVIGITLELAKSTNIANNASMTRTYSASLVWEMMLSEFQFQRVERTYQIWMRRSSRAVWKELLKLKVTCPLGKPDTHLTLAYSVSVSSDQLLLWPEPKVSIPKQSPSRTRAEPELACILYVNSPFRNQRANNSNWNSFLGIFRLVNESDRSNPSVTELKKNWTICWLN